MNGCPGNWVRKKFYHRSDNRWRKFQQKMVPNAPTQPYSDAPEGMVRIPAAEFDFKATGIIFEDYSGQAPAERLGMAVRRSGH